MKSAEPLKAEYKQHCYNIANYVYVGLIVCLFVLIYVAFSVPIDKVMGYDASVFVRSSTLCNVLYSLV
jgi:hypothetical protein